MLGTEPTTAELLKLTLACPITFVAACATSDIPASLILLGSSVTFALDAGASLGKRVEE